MPVGATAAHPCPSRLLCMQAHRQYEQRCAVWSHHRGRGERVRANLTGGLHEFNMQCLELARKTLADAADSSKPAPLRGNLEVMFVPLPCQQPPSWGTPMVKCVQETVRCCRAPSLLCPRCKRAVSPLYAPPC